PIFWAETKPRKPRICHSPEYWLKHIQASRQSGLSKQAYCEQNDLAPSTFFKWERRLEKQTAQFVAVSVMSPVEDVAVKIILPNGIGLSLPVNSDPECLRPWIKTLAVL
ncbi:MAG: hypothetical protein OEZ58_23975, partial [Gammaproteobacteria bacterium]|nr:hypothetical protein [Gammaproteobacteria bacterium]